MEYDDGAHGKSAESVGEGIEGVMGDHGDNNLLDINNSVSFPPESSQS